MDTLLSGSTAALFLPPLPPLRTVTPTSASSSVSASSTSSFLGFSRNRRRISSSSSSSRRPLQWCSTSSSYPSTVPKCTITCGAIREINENEFSASVLKADRPVLVEFVANWCGPCRLIAPTIEWVAQEYGDRLTVVKIDHDANPRLIEEYKVYGLPALILFKDGQEVPESRREGAITKAKLKDYLDTLLDSISVA